MQLLFASLVLIFLILLFCYHWRRRHIYILASKLSGPKALPLIGNGLTFLCKSEDILGVMTEMISRYTTPVRFWFGAILVVCFKKPQHIEKILSSSKLAHKHEVYKILQVYLGDGLVSSLGGEKYKKHRKLIQPLISLRFATENIDVFQRHINILMNKLETHVDKGTFDIYDTIHNCCADIIGESVLGMKMNSQLGKNGEYVKAVRQIYDVGYERLMRPWLHPDLIYNCTSGKKDQDRLTSISTTFIKDTINKAFSRLNGQHTTDNDGTTPIIDQIAGIIEKDPNCMNSEDFLYHMFTLYLASEDTLSIIITFLCVCFGMYPEYQKKAVEEIYDVLGETPKEITYDDLLKLQYLDMCVKDVLRLIPIAPIIIRKTVEDFHIDEWTIPKDCGVMVSIFDIHRDPEHWENPNHFHPDHFLPEATSNRHPFAYVPFSGGPRSCIGKMLAFVGLRLTIANILQKFEIEADGKFTDIRLRTDITVRSLSGYRVRLKNRK